MSTAFLQELKTEIDERQVDLNATLLTLEKYAANNSYWAKRIRVAIIFLGAFAATNAVADKVAGNNYTSLVTVLYSLTGLLIATLAGIEVAFGFQKKSADLRILAAECQSCILDIDCKIPQDPKASIEERVKAVNDLLALQNKTLKEIQGKAAEIGVNITRKIRKLKGTDAEKTKAT
jgi:uncharacterized membrane protein YraQ (UPF0718 family)